MNLDPNKLRSACQQTLDTQLKEIIKSLPNNPEGFGCLMNRVNVPGTEIRLILAIGPMAHPFEQLWIGLGMLETSMQEALMRSMPSAPQNELAPNTSTEEIRQALEGLKK